MRPNRFLENAWKGAENPILQVAAIGVTWMIFMIIGGSVMLVPVAILMARDPAAAEAYLANPFDFKLLGIDMIVIFAMIMCQFVIGIGGIWLTERTFLQKKLLWVATGFKRFRFGRMLTAMALWMGLMAIYQLITYLMDPSTVTFTVDLNRFLMFLPVALIMVPLQSAYEELAIRGQLMQGLIRLAPDKPYLPLFLTSLIFALLHFMNNEVQEYGAALMMAHYFTFGLVLGIFALIDEGLEMSIGIHAGNNIFSLCLVSYPGSSIQTPALMQQNSMTALLDYAVMIGFVILVYFIFFGHRKQAWMAIVDNVSTDPAHLEAEDAVEKVR
jgi:uncharacterized protein